MEQLFRPASAPTDRLVLYFNGWALSPIAVEHLGLPEQQEILPLGEAEVLYGNGAECQAIEVEDEAIGRR